MRKILLLFLLLALGLLTGCTSNGKTKFSYWQGGVTSEMYVYGGTLEPHEFYYKIVGYPYLILEYNVVSNLPINAVFGFSSYERTCVLEYEFFDYNNLVPPIGPPELVEGSYGYEDKFEFSGTVVQIVPWGSVRTNEDFSVGLWEFWFDFGEGYNLHFSFNNQTMSGEFNNAEPFWNGYGSAQTKSINMQNLKTDNGWE